MFFCILTLWSTLIFSTSQFQQPAAPKQPYIKVDALKLCPVSSGEPIDVEIEFFEIRENDFAITGRFVLPTDLTEQFQYNIMVHKWVNGAWQENVHQTDGPICRNGHSYCQKLWDRIVDDEFLAFAADCPIPAGEYNMVNFELNKDDFQLPALMHGRIKFVVEVYDEDEEKVFCAEFEGLIKE